MVGGREAAAGEVLVRFREAMPRLERLLYAGGATRHCQASDELPSDVRRMRSRSFDVLALLGVLRAHPAVTYVEPNYIVRTRTVPDDPEFSLQWRLLNAGQSSTLLAGIPGADVKEQEAAAWDVTTGSTANVVGCYYDTGVDFQHSGPGSEHLACASVFSPLD